MCNTCGCKDAESFGAETFELIMIDSLGKRETFGEYETYEDAEIDLEESFPREDYEMMDFEIINKSTNPPSRKHKFGAESFEAQTKLTAFTRGKDWEGKPYTGQIFPDHPDLDHELADRNQDGKMASWERAIGNQVARGKSRFKAPRKMAKTTTKFTQRKPITAASSLLPYAIAVGALATIFGLRGKE
tara:strand:+ start:220 stop:783 length:564 start_codon:yes stop_codon:yes gene_type:complete